MKPGSRSKMVVSTGNTLSKPGKLALAPDYSFVQSQKRVQTPSSTILTPVDSGVMAVRGRVTMCVNGLCINTT